VTTLCPNTTCASPTSAQSKAKTQKKKPSPPREVESETQLVIAWFILLFWGTGCLDILSWRGSLIPLIHIVLWGDWKHVNNHLTHWRISWEKCRRSKLYTDALALSCSRLSNPPSRLATFLPSPQISCCVFCPSSIRTAPGHSSDAFNLVQCPSRVWVNVRFSMCPRSETCPSFSASTDPCLTIKSLITSAATFRAAIIRIEPVFQCYNIRCLPGVNRP
jgi:hypothetical protein